MRKRSEDMEEKATSKEFNAFFRNKLISRLAKIEKLRRKCLVWIVLVIIFFAVADSAYAWYITSIDVWEKNTIKLMAILVTCPFIISGIIGKVCYKNKAKAEILEKLMSFIGNFYINTNKDDEAYVEELNLFDTFNKFDCDDRLTGKYGKLDMDIQELDLKYKAGRNEATIFKGIFIKVQSLKNYTGMTIVEANNFGSFFYKPIITGSKKSKTENLKLERVMLEDPEFNKLFKVESTNQIEARYLLTTAFMNRMVKLSNSGYKGKISLSFEMGKVNLALSSNKDWFEVPLMKNALLPDNYRNIILEIVSLVKLIDDLNLDSDIGL